MFYRAVDGYEDKYVCVTLKIMESVTYVDDYYNEKDYLCYLCQAEDGSEYRVILRDCLIQDAQRFVKGDVITVYGEGAGDCNCYDFEGNFYTAPCLNMAYMVVN